MEFSGDLRKNEDKNNKIMPSQILSAEQRQNLPVNIQPMLSLALTKINDKSRDQFFFF